MRRWRIVVQWLTVAWSGEQDGEVEFPVEAKRADGAGAVSEHVQEPLE